MVGLWVPYLGMEVYLNDLCLTTGRRWCALSQVVFLGCEMSDKRCKCVVGVMRRIGGDDVEDEHTVFNDRMCDAVDLPEIVWESFLHTIVRKICGALPEGESMGYLDADPGLTDSCE